MVGEGVAELCRAFISMRFRSRTLS